eukprot:gnl/TRDRNA2_/TRDRNA2_64328_c0_seq1.p1 gnl/TRDRNA2_/TRDRNA2_64328_c0~~gnl/TRDRNA2_/TRDRNA2_64328_c0_seq1.p1  ORF type:complete len:377 (+),score=54.22 gnl/TRDRNA2_/TRDRNA2_64328_c0_seq1:2-1132(+)
MLQVAEGEDADVTNLLRKFDSLALALAGRLPALRRVTQRTRAMVAVYPAGSCGYVRHVDNPGRDPTDRRRLTCIYYLNIGWSEQVGGVLRLHLQDGAVDIPPTGDRFVCFWADQLEHEVLPTGQVCGHEGRARAAISVWFSEEAASADGSGPERPLPVQAVHALAGQLAARGAVRLPTWLLSTFSVEDLQVAARVLKDAPLLQPSKQGERLRILGQLDGGSDKEVRDSCLHGALRVLSEASAACYCDTSMAIANCVGCAERLLKLLADSAAPGGWEKRRGLEPRAIRLVELTPGSRSVLHCEEGAVLGCTFGFPNGTDGLLTASVVTTQQGGEEKHVLDAGDVLLLLPSCLHPGKSSCWRVAASAKAPALRLEVWL